MASSPPKKKLRALPRTTVASGSKVVNAPTSSKWIPIEDAEFMKEVENGHVLFHWRVKNVIPQTIVIDARYEIAQSIIIIRNDPKERKKTVHWNPDNKSDNIPTDPRTINKNTTGVVSKEEVITDIPTTGASLDDATLLLACNLLQSQHDAIDFEQ